MFARPHTRLPLDVPRPMLRQIVFPVEDDAIVLHAPQRLRGPFAEQGVVLLRKATELPEPEFRGDARDGIATRIGRAQSRPDEVQPPVPEVSYWSQAEGFVEDGSQGAFADTGNATQVFNVQDLVFCGPEQRKNFGENLLARNPWPASLRIRRRG